MRAITPAMFAVIVLLPACRDNRATTAADPWTRYPTMEFISADNCRDIPADQYALVVRKEGEALEKLDSSPWVKVSDAEAKAYTGKILGGAGSELVLLRALALNEGNGAFEVAWRAGEVRVHHGCLGRSAVPQTRRAVIARLPASPSQVYVDCSMAQ